MKKCAWVDNFISIETDGWTRPCCGETNNKARIIHISNGIMNAFNHDKLISLKENLETQGFSPTTDYACIRCRKIEENGEQSLRTLTPFLSDKRELKAIQFKISNKCQLVCAHCGPDRSSGWAKLLNIKPHTKVGFKITDEFLHELATLLPNLEIIKFTGGEPFLDPDHWKILEFLSNYNRKHCRLVYITNGLVKPNAHLWKGWKEINCDISIEGFEKSYEWFRRQASWEQIQHNIHDLAANMAKVGISYSITPWTAADFAKSVEFWKDFNINPFPVINPITCSLKHFPRRIAEKYFNNCPYFNLTTDTNNNLKIYKYFATEWDKKWNTPGMAFDLFPWLNDE